MINTIIVLGTFGFLYLFVLFMTPVKPPEPIRRAKVVEVVVDEKAETAQPAQVAAPVAVETNPVDINRGKEIYLNACIKCHNKDPNVKGPIGPEMVDAPLEVMQVKVVTGRYPEVLPAGFVPKRQTKQMQKLPQYEKDVPSIHAYVQSLKKK